MKEQLISEFCVEACEAASDPMTAYDLSSVCEFAHKMLVMLHPEIKSHDEVRPDGAVRYTKASQHIFDRYLSEVECSLEEVGLIYNYPNCTWIVKGEKDA